MTMLNPARYQKVLQGMPDQALMQLLKRPDKIPSQFVIQEINRRKQMRQAQAARQQQVALASTMQQGMGDPAAAAGQNNLVSTDQPAMAKDGGHARYLHTGGQAGHRHPHLKSSFGVATPINRTVPNPRHAQYEFDMTDVPQGPYGFTPLYDIESKRRALNIRNRPYILGGLSLNPLQTFGSMFPKYKPSETEKRTADTEEAYLAGQSMQGRQAGQGITNLIEPDDFTDIAMKGDNNELDSGEMTADDFTEASMSGIKSDSVKSEGEKIASNNPESKFITELGENSAFDFFKTSMEGVNNQLKRTNNKFGASQLQKGLEDSIQFNELEEAYQDLDDAGKKRVKEYNEDSKKLLDERKKFIAKLEAGGRSPSNIVYESLIQTGLNLMASPDANFMQALGKAGQVGFAKFQNLRKEEKERVKEMHKMSYDMALAEFQHKQKASEIEDSYNLKAIDGKTALFNAKEQAKKSQREETKLLADIDYQRGMLDAQDKKIALQGASNVIAAFNADTNRIGKINDAIYRKMDTDIRQQQVDKPTSDFRYLAKEKGIDKAIEQWASMNASKVADTDVQLALMEKAIPELMKTIDEQRLDEEGYVENYIIQANKVIEMLTEAYEGAELPEN